MTTLFPLEPIAPEGFQYLTDFITAEEEQRLLQEIGQLELHTFLFQGYEAKRKVASFGYDWKFETRELKKGKSIPKGFQFLLEKVAAVANLSINDIAELLVTEYPPGAVINWHRDAPPFDLIAGISLLSDCRFRFRPHNPELQSRASLLTTEVERRSLYIMQGPSRTEWQHSIPAGKQKRYSITLRTLLKDFPVRK